jgi:RNA polymerase sigma-70 factor (ECF subfamily)
MSGPRHSPASVTADALVGDEAQRLPLTETQFRVLYARMSAPLARYLRRLTNDAALAEDLLQDTFVRLLGADRLPDSDDHLRNYLYRIATNLARDHHRQARRRPTFVTDNPPERSVEPEAPSDVWTKLDDVTARDRELLLLAYVEGLTHREIAGVTGLMTASIRPLLFRARRRFAAVLREAGLAADHDAGARP